jgi:hypothetical protein
MRVRDRGRLATGAVLILVAFVPLLRSAVQPPKPPGGAQPPDLAPFLELAKYYVTPVEPKKDARTGFVVGGKNDTALIRSLKEINGRSIAELEKDMRPGAKSDVGSTAGFLGPEEKLVDVLVGDNRYVVDELGLTHQELAKHLHAIGSIGRWQVGEHRRFEYEFVYYGRRFKATTQVSKGFQPSPFRDGTQSGTDVTVENLDTGKKLSYGLLVPHLIERYGFYEGKGTAYRVEPSTVVEVFDFLQRKAKKR